MYRWAITFSVVPHVGYCFGSNAPTRSRAYHEALRLARAAIGRREVHMVEIADNLLGDVRTFGGPLRRPMRWDFASFHGAPQ